MRRWLPVLIVVVSTGCVDIQLPMFPDLGSLCETTCEIPPTVTPWSPHILRGDSIRFTACGDSAACRFGIDTGNVMADWTMSEPTIAAMTSGPPVSKLYSRTNVWVRGVQSGHASLTVTFPKFANTIDIQVADSSEIIAVKLPSRDFTGTVHVGVQQDFAVHLQDIEGFDYVARPTAVSISDSSVLQVTRHTSSDGLFVVLRVVGLRAGSASLQVSFLGVTAERPIIVVP